MKNRFLPGNTLGFRHGYSPKGGRSPEYTCWIDIKERCLNSKHKYFEYYGGRGITICDQWRDDFMSFLSDVGERPSDKHTIDRWPDNDGNYEPGNVRWATRKEQVANRRSTRFVIVDGQKIPLSDAIRMLGLNRRLVCARIERGWTAEEAISKPAKWNRPDLTKKAQRRRRGD